MVVELFYFVGNGFVQWQYVGYGWVLVQVVLYGVGDCIYQGWVVMEVGEVLFQVDCVFFVG